MKALLTRISPDAEVTSDASAMASSDVKEIDYDYLPADATVEVRYVAYTHFTFYL